MKNVTLFFVFLFLTVDIFSQTSLEMQVEEGVTEYKSSVGDIYNPSNKCSIKAVVKSTLSESFESSQFPPAGWKMVDADGDGHNFFRFYDTDAYDGNYSAASASWLGGLALTPDNHLITPALLPVAGDSISFVYAPQDTSAPADKFRVLLSTSGSSLPAFTDTLFIVTLTDTLWISKKIDLTPYAGDTIFISFNHFDCTNNFYMKLDDIHGPQIYFYPDAGVDKIISPVSECGLGAETVKLVIRNFSQDTINNLSVAFRVDTSVFITETFTGVQLYPFDTVHYTFSTKANLSTAGIHTLTAKVILPGDGNSLNDSLSVNINNLTPKQIPFYTGFENDTANNEWILIDNGVQNAGWHTITNGVDPFNGTGYAFCGAPSTDDWLISPCVNLVAGQLYEVSLWTKTKVSGDESFEVLYGMDNKPAMFTNKIFDFNVTSSSYLRAADTFKVSVSGTYFFAVHANGTNSSQTFYVDDFMIDDVFTGIDSKNSVSAVSVFPNPVDGKLNVGTVENMIDLKVYDIAGSMIYGCRPYAKSAVVDMSGYATGLYFLKVETAGGVHTKKIIRK